MATTEARERRRRQRARRVPRVHARLLDVLHHPGDEDVAGAVPQGVHVHLDGVLQEPVDEDGALGGDAALAIERAAALTARPEHRGQAALEAVVVVDELHVAPAEDVARPHQDRVPDLARHRARPCLVECRAPGRLAEPERRAQRAPALAVLGEVDRVGRGAEHQRGVDRVGELERGLAPEGHDDPDEAALAPARGELGVEDVGDVLDGDGLEVEAVGRVVVGRHGLGVAVDHDRLVARVVQGARRVHAAVVELDALADAVRPRAQDDDPVPVRRGDLVLVLVATSSGTGSTRRTPPRRCRRS